MRAQIKIGDTEITLDGSSGDIASVIRELLRSRSDPLALTSGVEKKSEERVGGDDDHSKVAQEEPSSHEPVGPLPNARDYFEDRAPTNNREATAVAAHYLREIAPNDERSDTITKDQLLSVFREARWQLPPRPEQLLVDSATAGYLKRVARGKYELTNVGHNLVVHTLGSREQS